MSQRAIPRLLLLERVPQRVAVITALASVALAVGAAILAFPLWAIAGLALLPLVPVCCVEAVWKQEHYGIYALFGVLTILQLGHMTEHTVQMFQLLATHGDLKASRGVFGQLDLEAVHFFWNLIILLGTCLLLCRLGPGNRWLWVAFFAASFHMVEHFYLYWTYLTDFAFYRAGGVNGILAQGGMIGSPLARPYLHFVYNALEVTPFVLAFWDQTRTVVDRYLARASPRLTSMELAAATAQLTPVRVKPGEVIVWEGEPADRFYIIGKGAVDVLRAEPGGNRVVARLSAGQFFGAAGLLADDGRRSATVRARVPTELLSLDRAAFNRLFGAGRARAELEAVLADRKDALRTPIVP